VNKYLQALKRTLRDKIADKVPVSPKQSNQNGKERLSNMKMKILEIN
jgi:hypothetical protein